MYKVEFQKKIKMPAWSQLTTSLPLDKWRDIIREYLQNVPLSATLAAGAVGLALITWMVKRDKKNLPPGPAGLPFLGAMHKVGQKMHEDIEKLRPTYGDIISFRLMGK